MGKLNSNQIERLAVDAVKKEANRPFSGLVADIKEGDKGVSFDGDITVFIDNTETVEAFLGKVQVQIKGKEVSRLSGNTRTFPLSLKHIKNYYKQSGVLFFVVELNLDNSGNMHSKIFYKQLLPQELSNLIRLYDQKKKQGSKSIELRALEESDLRTVCVRFLNEQKEQPLNLIERDISKNVTYQEYELRSLTYNPDSQSTSNVYEHDFFLYGKDNNYNILVPLLLGRIQKIGSQIQETLTISGDTYQFNVKTTEDEKCTTRNFEDTLILTHQRGTKKLTFNLTNFKSLTLQLKTLKFMKSILLNLEVPWKGEKNEFENGSDIKEYIKNIDVRYKLMLEVQKVFLDLNIPEDTLIEQRDQNKDIFDQLKYLVDFYLHNNIERLNIPNKHASTFFNYKIGNRMIVLFYCPSKNKKIVNLFAKEVCEEINSTTVIKNNITNESAPHSPYVLIDLESLAYALNINLDIVKESFNLFDPFLNELASGETNRFYLNCIRAFDITNKVDYLNVAEFILNKYHESPTYKPKSLEAAIVIINEMQIRERKTNKLSESDLALLIDLKFQFDINEYTSLHFSMNVLLKNKEEAIYFYKKLEKNVQESFREYPIYFLYDQLIREDD
ncbi:hypothetical protein [Paenibacillus peoriae]|uniref:hypothetical protein n=1 Tax=Paenibacillus peoriae TaxID=59893 RepID=UPI001CC1E0C1|nr:hypothetical protein [Paenibacillus peoriae]